MFVVELLDLPVFETIIKSVNESDCEAMLLRILALIHFEMLYLVFLMGDTLKN